MLNKTIQTLAANDFDLHAPKISADPFDRVVSEFQSELLTNNNLVQQDKLFFDVHAHSFTFKHVPYNFNKILGWLNKALGEKFTKWLSNTLNLPFNTERSKEVMDALVDIYDNYFMDNNITPHLFIVNLMMDMERGISGKIEVNFDKQIRELMTLRKLSHEANYLGGSNRTYDYKKTILPFLAVDPNNPNLLKHFLSAFTENLNLTDNSALDENQLFFGVKVYPTLGYMPYDPTLMKIFKICAEKNIPVTTHCGGIRTRANHWKFELGDFRKQAGQQYVEREIRTKKEFKNYFVYPKHWEPVLKEIPNLKLNLAHIADGDDWDSFVGGDRNPGNMVVQSLEMIRKNSNVYADISYSLYNEKYQRAIHAMMKETDYREKILFGSDYFLVELEKGSLIDFIKKTKHTFRHDSDLWRLLTCKNPYDFLFGS